MSTIEQYRSMLRVNKHRMDDELEVQAEVMDRINQSLASAELEASEAKDELARLEARLAAEFKEDDTKLSLDAVAGKVRRDRSRIQAWDRLQARVADHKEWAGLHEAWKARGFAFTTLANLYVAGYFTLTSIHGDRESRREESRQQMRREIREASPAASGKTTRTRLNP